MMEDLFLNYSPLSGFAVQAYRNSGWVNSSIAGFVADVFTGTESNIGLDEIKEGLISVNPHDWCCFPEDRGIVDEIVADIREAIAGY